MNYISFSGFFKVGRSLRDSKSLHMLIAVIFMALSSGCKKFVQVGVPTTQLTSAVVFENRSTANAALMEVYAKLRDNGPFNGNAFGISRLMGSYADDVILSGDPTTAGPFYNNILLGSHSTISQWWGNSYKLIYSTNALIEGLEASVAMAQTDKQELTGEALFLRTFIHFHLLNLYGKIPYIRTTDYKLNTVVSRMDINEVYKHIVEDLSLSVTLLPANYIGSERVRVNKSVARALLARVYLYLGDWEKAAATATLVINNPLYVWETDLDKMFLKGSSTAIWQFKPTLEGVNAEEAIAFRYTVGSPNITFISDALLQAFEPGDQRRIHWITRATTAPGTVYIAFKYKLPLKTTTSQEYSILFRLAEQYLIRAEARAQLGDLEGAKDDLNKIRNTAGLGNTLAITREELLNAIQRERRVELFTESGHRFFDLKRMHQLDNVLPATKPGWNATDSVLPVPESELLINPNLKPQNLGY